MPRGVTRYYELATLLRSQVSCGEYAVGDKIPSATALAERYELSLDTVRRALEILVSEGTLSAQQGRGTFVKRASAEVHGANMTVPLESLLESGRTFPATLVGLRERPMPAWVANAFGGAIGDPVLEVERVRYRLDGPLVYSRCYVPNNLSNGLAEFLAQDWTPDQQLQLFIESAAGVHIDAAHQQTDATAADHDSARYLDVALGSPILRGYRWYYSNESVVYCGVYTWPGDRFRLQIVLNSSQRR